MAGEGDIEGSNRQEKCRDGQKKGMLLRVRGQEGGLRSGPDSSETDGAGRKKRESSESPERENKNKETENPHHDESPSHAWQRA